MPSTRGNDPQSLFLSAVRESQGAVIDTVRTWTDVGQRLTRDLRPPFASIDVADAVDRVFDIAEQTLAVQRQLALTLAGVATHQVDIAVSTVVGTIDTAVEGAETTVETVEGTVRETAHRVEQDRRPDGRTYEERTLEELQERATELEIEGRSSMSKDQLIAALRDHRKARSARSNASRSQPPKQDRAPDRRVYEERSIEELRERARELEIEGRSVMSKDQLVAALRQQAK